MNLKEAKVAIATCIQAGIVPYLVSLPGVGKSQGVYQVAKDFVQGDCCTVIGSQIESVDLRGVPSVFEGVTKWNRPDFLPLDGKGLLFLDELPQSAISVTNAFTSLILDRRVGDYVLPEGWHVVAAGNPRTCGARANDLPTHLRNRMMLIPVEVSVDIWIEWAEGAGIDPRVIAFHKYQDASDEKQLLHVFDKDKEQFPSPRTWEMVHRVLQTEPPESILPGLVNGLVGEEAGASFLGFLELASHMPSIQAILDGTAPATRIERPDIQYVAVSALVGKMGRGVTLPQARNALLWAQKALHEEFLFTFAEQVSKAYSPILTLEEMHKIMMKMGRTSL